MIWLFKCDCGNYHKSVGCKVSSGNTKSCGKCNKHYMSKTPLYNVWCDMVARCSNPNHQNSKHYYQRGIRVCKEWKNSFVNFMKWSLSNGYLKGLTIDRINVNGNYEPNNCRWVDYKVQARNKTNNKLLAYKGVTKPLCDWALDLGIKQNTLLYRKRRGWSDKDTIEKPIKDVGWSKRWLQKEK